MTLSAIPHKAAGNAQTIIVRAARLAPGDFIVLGGGRHAHVLHVRPWDDDPRWPRDIEEVYRIDYLDTDGHQSYLLPKASEEFRALIPADHDPRQATETVERDPSAPRTFVA